MLSRWVQDLSLSIASILVDPQIPIEKTVDWQLTHPWTHQENNALSFEATSHTLISSCKQYPDNYIHFPMIIQGIHEVLIDNKIVASSGRTDFKFGSYLYNSLDLSCRLIQDGNILTWKVYNLTHSYASIYNWPTMDGEPSHRMMKNDFSASFALVTLLIGIIFSITFFKTLPMEIPISLMGISFFGGLFLIFTNAPTFNIFLQPYMLHRLHDSFLWICTIFIWMFFRSFQQIPIFFQMFHLVGTLCALFMIYVTPNLDGAQAGTTIAYLLNLLNMGVFFIQLFYSFLKHHTISKIRLLHAVSLGAFCLTGINDILMNMGILKTVPVFPVGLFFSTLLASITAALKIFQIYRERDFLRNHLEQEVAVKTKNLTEKSHELEGTIVTLKKTQAELIHSSKLASIGTLAAGLAHEINNALNFPIGVIPTLERIFSKDSISEKDRQKAQTIVKDMSEGLLLTRDIIANLKRYSRKDDQQMEKIPLDDIVSGTLLLLKNKLKDIQVSVDIPKDLNISGFKTGLSQILMNLISNSVDAMAEIKNNSNREIKIYCSNNSALIDHEKDPQALLASRVVGDDRGDSLSRPTTKENDRGRVSHNHADGRELLSCPTSTEGARDLMSSPTSTEGARGLMSSPTTEGSRLRELASGWASSMENSKIQLTIEDHGCGIPQNIIHQIFDPFFTTKDPGKGTGLGMYIVKREIENMGGNIQILSEVGKGTQIILTLNRYDLTNITRGSAA